jgi:hypothetical protein
VGGLFGCALSGGLHEAVEDPSLATRGHLVTLSVLAACTHSSPKRTGFQVVTATVTAAGATIPFPGGSLTVPAGAVGRPTTVHVRRGSALPGSPLAGVLHPIGSGVQIDLSGTQPAVPLDLSLL